MDTSNYSASAILQGLGVLLICALVITLYIGMPIIAACTGYMLKRPESKADPELRFLAFGPGLIMIVLALAWTIRYWPTLANHPTAGILILSWTPFWFASGAYLLWQGYRASRC